MVEASETRGSPSGAGQRKYHARTDVEGGVRAGERGAEDDEVHHGGRVGNFDDPQGGDEGALGDASMIPGHDAEQNGHSTDIDEGQGEEGEPDGARSFFGRARFARGDRDHFSSAETVDGKGHGDERRPEAVGEKSALRVVLRRDAAGREQRGADHDEGDDGGELDHGEPEFEASVGADAAEVDEQQEGGEDQNPDVGADAGKPSGHVGGGGDHFCADVEGEADPVSGAGDESDEMVEIEVAVDAEGSGGGMGAGEFAEGHGDGPVDEGGGDEAEDGGGAGDFHGGAGAEEEAGADGASDGDHGHLSGGELVVEAFFVGRGAGGMLHDSRGGREGPSWWV